MYDLYDTLGMDNLNYEDYKLNKELLRFMGISQNDRYLTVLYSLGAILIALIMAGSVSFIYNSFSISISQRTMYFGLLSSIGPPLQQSGARIFEAFVLAAIGIPIGVLSGIAGIGVTLHLLRSVSSIMPSGIHISMTLSVSTLSVIAAVASHSNHNYFRIYTRMAEFKDIAIDAIRQTTDIKLTTRQVRTWKWSANCLAWRIWRLKT